ncbi:MAG: Dabb family protein [Bacteroidota bacterium]|nr:Dabb family protein [Bacteroidota bacterium]
MIRHIVMIKLKNFSSKEVKITNAKKLKSELENLENKIDEIKYYEVGLNLSTSPSAYDVVLVSDFNNMKELNDYRIHPEHIKVLDFLKSIIPN